MAKKLRRTKKQSGNLASTIAGAFLREFRGTGRSRNVWYASESASFTVGDMMTLAASVLSQDETKGHRK